MDFDPRLTFDTFVVGPANRLAYAAARRAAESPGKTYNPLFLYAASGLGKSHILSSIAQHTLRNHSDRRVTYLPLESYLDELTEALERGEEEAMRERYRELDTLLLDDVQFLTGQTQAQEMLLRALDALTVREAQVVLASDRPPSEIDGLDERLLSRFSGGLIVDIGQPDYETRVAIMRRKAEERGTTLGPGVAEAMARYQFRNVRELQGALNRLLAIQELEGRPVAAEDLPALLGSREAETADGGLRDFLQDVGEAPGAGAPATPAPSEAEWRRKLREAAEGAEAEGFQADRLRRLLQAGEEESEPEGWEAELERFDREVARAREIGKELEALGNPWPEAAATLCKDPNRLEEAEHLLTSARERARPFPALPDGPTLGELKGKYPPLALQAAERLLLAERPDYNPLYLHSPDPQRLQTLLEAAGRTYLASHPQGRVGMISVPEFAQEFIRAISDGVAGAWRERWWTAEVLLLYHVEQLSSTERAQDEFFHLFEALKRRDSRVLLAADRSPSAIENVDVRLSSRFQGGLVVELGEDTAQVAREPAAPAEAEEESPRTAAPEPAEAAPVPSQPESAEEPAAPSQPESPGPPPPPEAAPEPSDDDDMAALRELAGVHRGRRMDGGEGGDEDLVVAVPEPASDPAPDEKSWFPAREKVVWDWPRLEDLIVEEEP